MTAMKNATVPVKVRPATRRKFESVRKITRLKYVEIADIALDSLIATDPQLEPLRKPVAAR